MATLLPPPNRYQRLPTHKHYAPHSPPNIPCLPAPRCDPYKDAVLPEAPAELVCELSKRYVYLYERITGEPFAVPDLAVPINTRIEDNLRKAGLC